MDPYAGCYAEFFEAHPEYLPEVIYRPVPGSDEPQMLMSTAAMEVFIIWAQVQGYVRRPERVPDLLKLLRGL